MDIKDTIVGTTIDKTSRITMIDATVFFDLLLFILNIIKPSIFNFSKGIIYHVSGFSKCSYIHCDTILQY